MGEATGPYRTFTAFSLGVGVKTCDWLGVAA